MSHNLLLSCGILVNCTLLAPLRKEKTCTKYFPLHCFERHQETILRYCGYSVCIRLILGGIECCLCVIDYDSI